MQAKLSLVAISTLAVMIGNAFGMPVEPASVDPAALASAASVAIESPAVVASSSAIFSSGLAAVPSASINPYVASYPSAAALSARQFPPIGISSFAFLSSRSCVKPRFFVGAVPTLPAALSLPRKYIRQLILGR